MTIYTRDLCMVTIIGGGLRWSIWRGVVTSEEKGDPVHINRSSFSSLLSYQGVDLHVLCTEPTPGLLTQNLQISSPNVSLRITSLSHLWWLVHRGFVVL